MLRNSLVCLLSLLHFAVFANVRINEVMQSNVNGIMDDYNEFPDSWVEIYNEDSVAFDFTGYSIALSKDFTESYPLMDTTFIEPNGFLIFYCDKEEYGGRHADFRLNCDEDSTLYLFDPVGHIVDSLFIPKMVSPDISYGRVAGTDSVSYFKKATPGAPNIGMHTSRFLKKPEFSIKGGVYTQPVALHLSLQGKYPADAVIRYTTNGSEPTEESPIAPDTILIYSTTAIRAKVFSDSALSRISKTHTYLIADRDYTLPVVSIVVDSSYLYDDEIGIMVEGTYADKHPDAVSDVPELGSMNYLFSWKRPVNIEYFDVKAGTSSVINQLCEIGIGGNTSPLFPVKSLNVKAGKRFGDSNFSYAFWNDKPNVTKSKTLYLRDAGQDFMCTHIRDAMNQMSFGQNVDLDWQACQPVVVLLNGEYYGMVNLREKSNKDYVWSNFNKLENIDMVLEGFFEAKAGDLDQYAYYYYLLRDSLATYDQLDKMIDSEEFGNYFLMHFLFNNTDFPFNNQLLWKERDNESAKWRFLAKDLDMTDGYPSNYSDFDFPYLEYILQTNPAYDSPMGYAVNPNGFAVFKKMMQYPQFRNRFIDKAAVYMGTFVSSESLLARIDSLSAIIDPEIPYYYDALDRPVADLQYWRGLLNEWVEKRVPFCYQHVHEFFDLGDTTSVSIRGYNKDQLYFNGVKVKGNKFDGRYFIDRPIYLSRCDSAFSYVGDSIRILASDSVKKQEDGGWWIRYNLNGEEITKYVARKSLYLTLPKGVEHVQIVDTFFVKTQNCDGLQPIVKELPESSTKLDLEELELIRPTASDVFGKDLECHLNTDSTVFGVGEQDLVWLFELPAGKSVACVQNISIMDVTPPVLLTCESLEPLVVYLEKDQCGLDSLFLSAFAPVAIDNGEISVVGTLGLQDTVYSAGVSTIQWRFSDASANTLVCRQEIAVVDTVSPAYEDCNNMPLFTYVLKDERSSVPYGEMPLDVPVAEDNCGMIEGDLLATDDAGIGVNLIYWTFVDSSGNYLFCPQKVAVVDSFAPRFDDCLSMPTLTFDLEDNSCGLIAQKLDLEVPVAMDNEGALEGKLVAPDTLSIGWNAVCWMFIDSYYNMTACTQMIVVEDKFAPQYDDCDDMPTVVYELKDNVCTVPADAVTADVPVAIDNCDVPIYGRLDSDSDYEIGVTERLWHFVDASGNELLCPQTVEVVDKCAPYINCETLTTLQWSLPVNETKMESVDVELPVPYAVDNCNELVMGVADISDVLVEGNNPIVWTFVDESGNESVCQQTLTMSRNFVLCVGPNPFASTLVLGGVEEGTPIQVVNTVGEIMLDMVSYGSPMSVDVTTWNKGVYFVRINGRVYKLIKK